MSNNNNEKGREQRTEPDVEEESLNFIYEHTKEAPNLQVQDSQQLDSKIAAVFAAATVAIGLATRLPDTDGPNLCVVVASWSGQINLVDTCFYLAVAAWGWATITTLRHLRTKKHRRSLRADVLWGKHRDETPRQLRVRLVKDIRKAFIHNAEILENKARTFNTAALATALEGLFIVLALVLSRFSG